MAQHIMIVNEVGSVENCIEYNCVLLEFKLKDDSTIRFALPHSLLGELILNGLGPAAKAGSFPVFVDGAQEAATAVTSCEVMLDRSINSIDIVFKTKGDAETIIQVPVRRAGTLADQLIDAAR